MGDHGTGTDGSLDADGDWRDQCAVGAYKGTVFDAGDRLVDAVIVAGDGAGTDVDATTDDAVAEIAEVVCLAVFADRGFLDLDEIADMRAAGQFGARTQAGERADDARTMGDYTLDIAMRMYHGTGGELHVFQPAECTDAHVIT